jgi:uncharacterized LabA/DUF88 family protein
MPPEPPAKQAVAFIDGQNLFHAVREAFGYTYPNYDVSALAREICTRQDWQLDQVRFYTGIPDPTDDPFWNHFRLHKLAMLGRQRVAVYSRPLRYRNRRVRLPDGTEHTYLVGEEKGIDVRIALDIVRMAHRREYDVALVFSQDQDLSEVAEEVRTIAREQGRWLKISSAYPISPTSRNPRGINKTDWIPIDRALYDTCLDRREYRPGRRAP